MASKPALKYNYSYTSDADADDDYDFALTAEEEDLLETLVASASNPTAIVQRPSHQAGVSANPAGASSLRSDIEAAFATQPSLKSLHESEIDFNVKRRLRDPGTTYPDGPLASQNPNAAEPPAIVDDVDDAAIMAIAEDAERRILQSGQSSDVKYPDCKRKPENWQSSGCSRAGLTDFEAFSVFEAHDAQASDSDSTVKPGQQEPSPLVRFRSFPKKPFSVSDLTAGAWCELQYFYTLTKLPGGKKTRTAAMKAGSKVHQKLEDEIYTRVTIEITKKEDAFGLKIWNVIQGLRTLRDTGITRELEVWGLVDGHVVNGVIDNLSYENPDPEFEEEVRSSQGSQETAQASSKDQKITTFFHSSAKPPDRQIYITDVKTRASRQIPSGAALRPTTIQLFLYHRFLSEMAAGRLDFMRVLGRYGLEPDEPFSDTFIGQIGSLHDEIFEDAVDDWGGQPKKTQADSSSSPAPSSPSSTPDLIRYRTLRQLISLLETELRLTFPHGADSVGSVVNVEYRKRARRHPSGDDVEDPQAGALLGANVLFVDPETLYMYLQKDLAWWEGRRPPRGVEIEEAYKCRSCEFADDCAWRQKQDADILAAAQERVARRKTKDDA